MSAEKNREEGRRWHETALGDLETARILLTHTRHAHVCFHAQQAGEKVLKALWYSRGLDPWGHSVQKLIEDLEAADPRDFERISHLRRDAATLDRFYIPTRYPNGLPDLTPDQAFFEEDARLAIRLCEDIIRHVASLL